MSEKILSILGRLLSCDTQNPPRELTTSAEIFEIIRQSLGPRFQYEMCDWGMGRINLLVHRGKPRGLFNVHLDTVPVGDGWNVPPLGLTRQGDRVFGRGSCDIKGAAACLIAAMQDCDSDAATLFSTDEEGSSSCCVNSFCQSNESNQFDFFVVAEPTGCLAVPAHRGYLSVSGTFQGVSGHSSRHELLRQSANHRAAGWIAQTLSRLEAFEAESLQGESCCFNVGRIDGGIKNNMIADRCQVTWSARMPAGHANQELLDTLISQQDLADWKVTFDGPPLPTRRQQYDVSRQWCQQQALPMGNPVDFWTEAALFARLGKPTIILGPGNIAQAHTTDEWVAVDQLEKCYQLYLQLINQIGNTTHEYPGSGD